MNWGTALSIAGIALTLYQINLKANAAASGSTGNGLKQVTLPQSQILNAQQIASNQASSVSPGRRGRPLAGPGGSTGISTGTGAAATNVIISEQM